MERTSLKYFATLILAMTLVACNSEPAPTEQEIHDANLRKYSAGTLQTELRSHYFPCGSAWIGEWTVVANGAILEIGEPHSCVTEALTRQILTDSFSDVKVPRALGLKRQGFTTVRFANQAWPWTYAYVWQYSLADGSMKFGQISSCEGFTLKCTGALTTGSPLQ
jgi:hypothetical protein